MEKKVRGTMYYTGKLMRKKRLIESCFQTFKWHLYLIFHNSKRNLNYKVVIVLLLYRELQYPLLIIRDIIDYQTLFCKLPQTNPNVSGISNIRSQFKRFSIVSIYVSHIIIIRLARLDSFT